MAEFILISTIINLSWAILWSKKDMFNFAVKVVYICMTVFGAYLLFGPANMIASLSH